MREYYCLSSLPYEYNRLEPIMSADQLKLHHDKHHKAYVEKANELQRKLEGLKGGGEKGDIDFGSIARKLSFNLGGHFLHTLFWENLRAPMEGNHPNGGVGELIERQFGSFEGFKKQFYEVATTAEGSGWAALFYDRKTNLLLIGQIQNHNFNVYPTLPILLVLDMWEHAYYLDYKNDKKKFAENFWQVVDWEMVGERFKSIENLNE